MPALTTITNAAWPTSGTPTTGNTGFSSLSSSGTLVFEVDENGETYITTTTANVTLVARINATAAVFASGETRYHCELVAYPEFTCTSDSNTLGSPSGFFLYLTGPSTSLSTVTLAAVNTTYVTGFAPIVAGVTASTATGAISGVSTISGVAVGAKECFGVNRKTTIGLFGDRTAGVIGMTMNGVRAGGWTPTTATDIGTDFSYQFPATPGVRWRIYASSTRPARSWTGTDHEFTADYANNPAGANDGLQYSLPHISTDGLHGNFWTYTGSLALTEYATSGGNPNRKRIVASTGGITAKSKISLGTLTYNEYGDYGIVTSFLAPSGKALSISLRNAGDTADVLKFQVATDGKFQDGSGTQLVASDGTAITIAADKRYFLIINLSRDGYAAWTLKSSNDDLARRAWSNAISTGWSVQSLGPIALAGDTTTEIDRFDAGPWITDPICDSLAVAYETAVDPDLPHTANNLGYGFPHSDGVAIPGIAYHNGDHGWPKESWMAPSGRSGRWRLHWQSYVRTYMTHTRAIRIVALDGGCWNDFANGATAATLLTYVQDDMTWCDAHNCQFVTMPAFDRPRALAQSATSAQRLERIKFNALQEAWVRSNASNPRLFYCDHPRAYRWIMRSTDGVHPASDIAPMTRAIAGTRMAARHFAALPSSVWSATVWNTNVWA